MTKTSSSKKTAQINMADVLASTMPATVADVETQSTGPMEEAPAAKEVIVTAKEAPVLAAIVSNKFGMSTGNMALLPGVGKSAMGIVASLGKKGFVIGEKSPLGTMYVATEKGEEIAALLS